MSIRQEIYELIGVKVNSDDINFIRYNTDLVTSSYEDEEKLFRLFNLYDYIVEIEALEE